MLAHHVHKLLSSHNRYVTQFACRRCITGPVRTEPPELDGASIQNRKKLTAKRLDKDIAIARAKGLKERRSFIRNYLSQNPILEPLRQDVKYQRDLIRSLKEQDTPEAEIEAAVKELRQRKKKLELKEAELVPEGSFVQRTRLDEVLKRRFFYDHSFDIYGGVSGLYDYGPPGVALKKNILRLWETHFIIEEDLLEIEASQLTPEPVLRASGHLERFSDLLVKDSKTGACYRPDHLIRDHLERGNAESQEIDEISPSLDGLTKNELGRMIRSCSVKAPETGNDLSEPVEFNLMFSTTIGASSSLKSFLRPETAQGIFVNFRKLLEANQRRLPFGVAQIGKSFRNEISPRGGLSRMREFTLGEIEYFVDPEDKKHPKFDSVKDLRLNLYSATDQTNGESSKHITLDEAVETGIVANEVLAYFLARINQFMVKVGVDETKIRFRQHMADEMAHYATDCWDCECLIASGWLECVGCADRSCYDLNKHAEAANVKLSASRPLKEPLNVTVLDATPRFIVIGRHFKDESKIVIDELTRASQDQLYQWKHELETGSFKLNCGEKSYSITKDMLNFKLLNKIIFEEEVVPNVIEPSFGIDRILYTVLEHNFMIREENPVRTYFKFPPSIAPIKCSILPLVMNEELKPFVNQVSTSLKKEGVLCRIEASGGSIGRRYSKTDELGIPFGVTIDFDTLRNRTVTLRNCITAEQILVDMNSIAALVRDLSSGKLDWTRAKRLWPTFTFTRQLETDT